MKRFFVTEFHELAKALVVIECSENVKKLLDQFEAGVFGLDEVLMKLRDEPGSDRAYHRNPLL